MESAMIRSQTWPCPCPRLILWNGSKSCSLRCVCERVIERDGEGQKKGEKRLRRRDKKSGRVKIGTVMTARKGRLDCANGYNNNDLRSKSREGLSGSTRSSLSNYNPRHMKVSGGHVQRNRRNYLGERIHH